MTPLPPGVKIPSPAGIESRANCGIVKHSRPSTVRRFLTVLVAHCPLGLGKLYPRIGKRQEGQEHLATATTMYREMAMTYWLDMAETG